MKNLAGLRCDSAQHSSAKSMIVMLNPSTIAQGRLRETSDWVASLSGGDVEGVQLRLHIERLIQAMREHEMP